MTNAASLSFPSDDKPIERRTSTDVVEALSKHPDFSNETKFVFRTSLHPTPRGDYFWGVIAICEQLHLGVPLPFTTRPFSTIRAESNRADAFEIARIEGAIVDTAGNVTLLDGTKLRGIEIYPARLLKDLSDDQMRIVQAAIRFEGAEARCYRERSFIDWARGEILSFGSYLDFSAVNGLVLHGLEDFMNYLESSKLGVLKSRQSVGELLTDCGIIIERRLPTTRRARKFC